MRRGKKQLEIRKSSRRILAEFASQNHDCNILIFSRVQPNPADSCLENKIAFVQLFCLLFLLLDSVCRVPSSAPLHAEALRRRVHGKNKITKRTHFGFSAETYCPTVCNRFRSLPSQKRTHLTHYLAVPAASPTINSDRGKSRPAALSCP